MSSGRRGMAGSTAFAELAYAHPGASRLSPPASRWPQTVIAVESPSVALGLDELPHGIAVEVYSDCIGALLAIGSGEPAAVLVPTDAAGADVLGFVGGVTAWSGIPVLVALGAGDDASETAVAALRRGARAIIGLPTDPVRLGEAMRAAGVAGPPAHPPLSHGPIRLEPDAFRAVVEGEELALTAREFLLLSYLIDESPRLVRVEELARGLASYDDGSVAGVRVLVAKVRRKLDAASPGAAELLETVRGLGYRMRALPGSGPQPMIGRS